MLLVEAALGFIIGYLYASQLESLFHDWVNDAPGSRVTKWKSFHWILAPMIRTHFSHHTIHHCRTYRENYVTQFRSLQERVTLNQELLQFQHGREIIAAMYGNRFSFWGWVAFCAPLVPGPILAFGFWGAPAALGMLLAVSLPPIMSNFVHEYLHMPTERALAEAPWPISWFARTPYFRFIARHHFLHHRYLRFNFNLVVGADLWRGKFRRPSNRDCAEMERLGLK
ncbi:MAG: hypothetical protein HYR96_04075 [Deltaproteobacteria bacterium]|nr:hypothetical protein [Deltaproteobacteria bacterium]MBI3295301.1 hypothetical protein [Deltaproteobacteria bacterium]